VISKRWLVGLAVPVVGALLFGAVACGGDDDPTPVPAPKPAATKAPAPTEAPAPTAVPEKAEPEPAAAKRDVPRNKTLIMVVSEAGSGGRNPGFENFSMFLGWPSWHTGASVVMNDPGIMFNVLTGFYEGWTVESWKYNSTFDELTMKLKEDVKWSDGKPLNADDWVFMFNYLRDAAGKVGELAQIDVLKENGASKVDDWTVKFELEDPSPIWWNTTISSNHGVVEQMLREDVWGGKDITEFSNYDPDKGWPLGTGPFVLASTAPEQTIYDRRDSWWASDIGFKPFPEIERVVVLPGREESEGLLMLARNEIDVSGQISVASVKSAIEQNPNVITFTGRSGAYGYIDWCPYVLGFNASDGIFADKDMRWAVNWAIDRNKLIDVAEMGAGSPALHPFVPKGKGRGGYSKEGWSAPFLDILDPIVESYGIDSSGHPDKLAKIMTDKGYSRNSDELWEKDGETIPFNFYLPEFWKHWGPPMAQQLRDGGFDASFDTSPGKQELMGAGEIPYVVCRGPSGVQGMDPWKMMDIYHTKHNLPTGDPGGGWGPDRWSNAEFDAITDEIAMLETTDPKMFELFERGMKIWIAEMPQIYFANLHVRTPNSNKYWTGWPSLDNPYAVDLPVQMEFLKTVIHLKATNATD
jgi:peptide/nickel transport system substrate-binding protein